MRLSWKNLVATGGPRQELEMTNAGVRTAARRTKRSEETSRELFAASVRAERARVEGRGQI